MAKSLEKRLKSGLRLHPRDAPGQKPRGDIRMLLSKLPVQKQDHPPKFLSLSPRRPNPVHPKSGLQLGSASCSRRDAVDHVRIGFEPAGQTEGSQDLWITIPSQKQLTAIVSVNCCGRSFVEN